MLGRDSQDGGGRGIKLVMSPNELQQTRSALSPPNNRDAAPAAFSLHCDRTQRGEIIFPFIYFFLNHFSISNNHPFLLLPSVHTKSSLISGAASKANILTPVVSDFVTRGLVGGEGGGSLSSFISAILLSLLYSLLNCSNYWLE